MRDPGSLNSPSPRPSPPYLRLLAALILFSLVSSSLGASYQDWYLTPETGIASTNCFNSSSPCPAFPSNGNATHLCYAGFCRFHLLPGEYNSPATGLFVAGNAVQVNISEGAIFRDTALTIESQSIYNETAMTKPLTIGHSTFTLSGNSTITLSSATDILLDHVSIAVNSSASIPIAFYTSGRLSNLILESTKIESIAELFTPSRAFHFSGTSYANLSINGCSFTGFTHTIVGLASEDTVVNLTVSNTKVTNEGGALFVPLNGLVLSINVILANNTFSGMATLSTGVENFPVVSALTIVSQNSFTGFWAFDVTDTLQIISNNFTDSETTITTRGARFASVELNSFHEAYFVVTQAELLQFARNTLNRASINLQASALAASHIKSTDSFFYLNTSMVSNFDHHYCSIQYSTFYAGENQVILDAQYFYLWKVDFTPVDAPSTDYTLSLLSTQPAPSMMGDFTAYGLTIDIQGARTLLFEGKLYVEKSLFGSTTHNGQVLPLPFDNAGSIIFGQSSFDGTPVKVDSIDFTSFANASFVASLYNHRLPVATFSGSSIFSPSNHTLYFFLNGPKSLSSAIAPGSVLSIFNGSIDYSMPFNKVIQPSKTLGYAGSVNFNLTAPNGPSVQYIVSSTSCFNNCSNRGQCVGANKCVCTRPYSGYDCSCDSLVGNAICNTNSYASGWNLAGSLDTNLKFPKAVDIVIGGDVLVQNSVNTEFNNALYDVRGNITISGTLSVSSTIERTTNASDDQNRCFFRATSRASSSGLSFGPNGVLHVKLDLTGAEKTICPTLTNNTIDSIPLSLDTSRELLGGFKRGSSSNSAGITSKIQSSANSILQLVRQDPIRSGNFENIELRASRSLSRDDYPTEFDTTLAGKSASLFQFDSFKSGGENKRGKIVIDLSGTAPSGPIEIRIFDAGLIEGEEASGITTGVVTGLDLIQVEVKDTPETCHELRGGPGIISLFLTPCDNKGFSKKGKLAWYAYGIPIIIVGLLIIAAVILVLSSSRVRAFVRPYSAASSKRAEELANQRGAK